MKWQTRPCSWLAVLLPTSTVELNVDGGLPEITRHDRATIARPGHDIQQPSSAYRLVGRSRIVQETMMMNPLAVVQEFYRAMAAGQIEKMVALLSPDLQWEEAERFPYYGGVWNNPQAVVDNLFMVLATDWEEFSATPHNFVCSDENVVSFGVYTGKFRATGRSISAPFAHRWLVRGERIAQFKQYTDTAKILEATIARTG